MVSRKRFAFHASLKEQIVACKKSDMVIKTRFGNASNGV